MALLLESTLGVQSGIHLRLLVSTKTCFDSVSYAYLAGPDSVFLQPSMQGIAVNVTRLCHISLHNPAALGPNRRLGCLDASQFPYQTPGSKVYGKGSGEQVTEDCGVSHQMGVYARQREEIGSRRKHRRAR